jgi:hypothetical protein
MVPKVLEGMLVGLSKLGIPIIPWEDCQITMKLVGHHQDTAAFEGTCLIEGIPTEVIFKVHHVQINPKTRLKTAEAVYTDGLRG